MSVINAIAPIIFNDEDELDEYDFASESDDQVLWEKSQPTKPEPIKGLALLIIQDNSIKLNETVTGNLGLAYKS